MKNLDPLIRQLGQLDTEKINPDTTTIDQLTSDEIVRLINNQDKTVAQAVTKALDPISRAAREFADTLRNGHRVFYIGAGTSGRLGVLDAAECPPTFGSDPKQIVGLISGGYDTLVLSKEGVEDDEAAARADLQNHNLTEGDFVIGIAASRRTPYTLAGVRQAVGTGCRTALIICNPAGDLDLAPDILIELLVGPEVITGSTRMKSGTAQKMTLNIISTTAMILLGKTYGNLMVDLQAKSEKLKARSLKMLVDLLKVTVAEAEQLLIQAGGSVKVAIVMHSLDCDAQLARTRLKEAGDSINQLYKQERNQTEEEGEREKP